MTGARNVKAGFVMLAVGLAAGLAMSLYAFQPMVPVPEGLRNYDDLPRRLFRLSHIAAIMLPLLNIVIGGWLDRLSMSRRSREAVSWLLVIGAIALPATLAIEGLFPTTVPLHLSGIPAVACFLVVCRCAVAALRTSFGEDPDLAELRRRARGLERREGE